MDKTQFETLFKTHYAYLCNFANQYVRDTAVAEDICQQVYMRLWEKRDEIEIQKSVKSYLFTSVKNRSLNYLRDHKRYKSQLLDMDCADIEIGALDDDLFAIEELQQKIDSALLNLPPKCRQVFEMSRYEDMKYREIAVELNISQKTVEAHMSKAMRIFREELGQYALLLIYVFIHFHR